MKKILLLGLSVAVLSVPLFAGAITGDGGETDVPLIGVEGGFQINPEKSVKTVYVGETLNKGFNIAFWALLVLATFFFIMGAYRYLTATDDNKGASKAQKTITNAVIAIVIAILSKGLALYIPALFGVNP